MKAATLRKESVIGIDFGTRCIKAVELHRDNQKYVVTNALILPRRITGIQIDQQEVLRLASVFQRRGFATNRVVTAIPAAHLASEVLELPTPDEDANVALIARLEMARNRKIAPDAFEITCWELPDARNGRTTLVFASCCEHRDANAYLDLYQDTDLNITALSTAPSGLFHAAMPLLREYEGLSFIIDIGWHSTRLILIYQGIIVFERKIEQGGIGRFHQHLCDTAKLDQAAADHVIHNLLKPVPNDHSRARAGVGQFSDLIIEYHDMVNDEIEASLAYARHQYSDVGIGTVLLVGCGAALPGLAERLDQSQEAAVQVLTPAKVADCREIPCHLADNPLLTAATGLALSGVNS